MEADKLKLESLMTEIKGLSEVKCEISEDWRFRPIGAKACGGPTGYIAYSSKIDTVAFIQKIDKYTADQKIFNENGVSHQTVVFLPGLKRLFVKMIYPNLYIKISRAMQ